MIVSKHLQEVPDVLLESVTAVVDFVEAEVVELVVLERALELTAARDQLLLGHHLTDVHLTRPLRHLRVWRFDVLERDQLATELNTQSNYNI